MFSNFLYFLVALILIATAEIFNADLTAGAMSFVYTLAGAGAFFTLCRVVFYRIRADASPGAMLRRDQMVSVYTRRLSILSLLVFALMIYGFGVNRIFPGSTLLQLFPTLRALALLCIFLCLLIMVWYTAYDAHHPILSGSLSRKNYILSNISFSLPALLPWLIISMTADILTVLPWRLPAKILETQAGEVGYVALFLIAVTITGPVFIKKLWLCRPLGQGVARDRIESVCRAAGLKYNDILVWDMFGGTMITAGVMGVVGRFRYILVTPALFNALEFEELDAVMLHEIGHVQRHHMLFYLFFLVGFILCNFVFFEPMMQLLFIAAPVYQVFDLVGIGRETAYPILIAAVMIGGFLLYFRYVFGFYMRNFERQADLHIYRFGLNAGPLISTFYKIASYSRQALDKPSWHHYSIAERILFLKRCTVDPEQIPAHHRKVKKMIVSYLAVMGALLWLGYAVSYGALRPSFDTFVAKTILIQQMEIEPDNAEMYTLVGDYFHAKEQFPEAVDAYENVLQIAPESIHALNNLAWLLATCPDPAFRDPPRSLRLAEKAASLASEAFVLDTYAEALYVNGDIEKAVSVARQALAISTDKEEYYREQVMRFEKLLPGSSI